MSIQSFFKTLNDSGIGYCQFKSTEHLDASFEGRTDFDILVSPEEADRFYALLYQWGFKQRFAHTDYLYSGMENYLWYDKDAEQMQHLHVHFRLILGESGIKNHRWKVESEFIREAVLHDTFPIKVAPLHLELPLLLIRTILKHRIGQDKKIHPDLVRELTFLIQQLPNERFASVPLCNKVFALLQLFIDEFKAETLSPATLDDYKQQLLPLLKDWQRFSDDVLTHAKTMLACVKPHTVRWLSNSGCQIAIIGADGAGKSTLVSDCEKWLNYKLASKQFYLGQNKTLEKEAVQKSGLLNKLLGSKDKKVSALEKHLFYANCRLENLEKGRSFSAQGGVCLYDRYPLKEFFSMPLPMDGPRLKKGDEGYEEEAELYASIPDYPDVLIVLNVPEDVAIARKPENAEGRPREILHDKIEAIQRLSNTENIGCKMHVVDASMPYEHVFKVVKALIWDAI